jgi:hypothetical protein
MNDTKETVFCSIGENCLGQGVLDRKNLNTIITPFSWGRSNVDYVLELIGEDFANLLNSDFLEYRDVLGKPCVKNVKYECAADIFDPSVSLGFEFTHHDVIASLEVKHSILRKIQRFRALVLESDQPIVMWYHHRSTSVQSFSYVEQQLAKLRSLITTRRGAGNVHVLAFTQYVVPQDDMRRVEVIHEGWLTTAVFYTRKLWSGNDSDVFWGIVDDDLFDDMLTSACKSIAGAECNHDAVIRADESPSVTYKSVK